MLFIEVLIS